MTDKWTVERMSLALQRAGALSRSHMTYHDLARDVLAEFGGEDSTRKVSPMIDPRIEVIADLLMDLRMDGPHAHTPSTLTYQDAMRHYAMLIVEAIDGTGAYGSGKMGRIADTLYGTTLLAGDR